MEGLGPRGSNLPDTLHLPQRGHKINFITSEHEDCGSLEYNSLTWMRMCSLWKCIFRSWRAVVETGLHSKRKCVKIQHNGDHCQCIWQKCLMNYHKECYGKLKLLKEYSLLEDIWKMNVLNTQKRKCRHLTVILNPTSTPCSTSLYFLIPLPCYIYNCWVSKNTLHIKLSRNSH